MKNYSKAEEIERLRQLLKISALTEEEFQREKQKVLNNEFTSDDSSAEIEKVQKVKNKEQFTTSMKIAYSIMAIMLLTIILFRPDKKPKNKVNKVNQPTLSQQSRLNPNIETFKEELEKVLSEQYEIGVLLNLEKNEGESLVFHATVSDYWFDFSEIDKERYATMFQDILYHLLVKNEIITPDNVVSLYIKDSYGIELASPKILGGYRILK